MPAAQRTWFVKLESIVAFKKEMFFYKKKQKVIIK